MVKKKSLKRFLSFVIWLTAVIVSLSVGFAMISGTLTLPYWLGGSTVAMIAGWIVVISTFTGVLTAIYNK